MDDSSVTLALPPEVYEQLQHRARQHQRRLEDEAILTLMAAIGDGMLPNELAEVIATLPTLDDDTLWRVSRSQPTVEDGVLLDALVDKRRRQGLTAGEERLLAELIDRHDRMMALRAEAVALLHARGIDVRDRVARA